MGGSVSSVADQSESPRHVLFVDYDGVLHRFGAFVTREGLRSSVPSIPLFEYAAVLDELIRPYPHVELVLSTSWVREFGFSMAKGFLSIESLRERVVDATYDSAAADAWSWPILARGVQVLRYVRAHHLAHWVAIDDEDDGFDEYPTHFVKCDEASGLGGTTVQAMFRKRLNEQFGPGDATTPSERCCVTK
ncbi:hypothetical protein WQE_08522 [Paraburkholderia hospita]|uniref:Hydrolase n=1 Tax=Paraburkholderia hospita TaxID=169430 RepID=A0ABP2PW70_9BURK|nr:HAD domain-containing protein [Paraburkholderia hospita]EIN01536.1 hypothetical protein WQE_08522 [Paraburkholderia hospita]OUL70268.1 hydrolase [Paraburkholderia hospita]